jgi:hypothetical protein
MQVELRDCFFYELYCLGCNSTFRLVLEQESVTSHACPQCGGVETSLELVGCGRTTRELPISQFLHRGRVLPYGEDLFVGTPRQRRMRFRESLPAAMRIHAGTH